MRAILANGLVVVIACIGVPKEEGRAGKDGEAITFLTRDDSPIFYDLKLVLKASKHAQMPPEFSNHPEANTKPGTINHKNYPGKDKDLAF